MKKKIALISGITGQDGSYLAELLLKKNYVVHGIKRKSSSFNTERVDHIYENYQKSKNFNLHYGDLVDSNSLFNLVNKIKPDEIYNLGAQSHVGHSFEIPEYTSEVTAIGTLRLLEAIRFLNLKKTKFYQASTSELFGEKDSKNIFQKNLNLYLNHHMVFQNYIHIGLPNSTEKLMGYLLATEFYLIMKVLEEVRHL